MKTLVVAPHPDDEILGCGGLLLRRVAEGSQVAIVFMTSISSAYGWEEELVRKRDTEIWQVISGLGLKRENVVNLGFPTTRLDEIPISTMVQSLSAVFADFQPNEILTPHFGDVHSDHRISAEVVASCTKWFRQRSISRVLAYETLSETGFGLIPDKIFKPNFFVNISPWLEMKLELLRIYSSELDDFPFPRSEKAIRALAEFRGSMSGHIAAEAFELLFENLNIET